MILTVSASMSEEPNNDLIEPKNSDDNTEEEVSEIHKQVQEYIGKRYEFYLGDGRIIRGTMIATDKDANMVINKADERWVGDPITKKTRYLGQAMISKKFVKSINFCPDDPSQNTKPEIEEDDESDSPQFESPPERAEPIEK